MNPATSMDAPDGIPGIGSPLRLFVGVDLGVALVLLIAWLLYLATG